MRWKSAALIVVAFAVLGATILVAHHETIGVTGREAYRRPAEVPHPPENPFTVEKAELGRKLFFDTMLSGPGSHSCSTCHSPALAWGDGLARAQGQTKLPLRSPTLIDIAWIPRLGWDGKFRDLESVAFAPITSRANMNLPEDTLLTRLGASSTYVSGFAAAFGADGITRRNIELALATYQRTIVSGQAPFDRWVDGDESAISSAAKRGFEAFNGKARCAGCHNGFSFTDGSFHDIGTGKDTDIGRGRLFPQSVKLRYAFKTPTLREVTRRAPYMHDGSIATLEGVIDLYDRGGIERPSRSGLIRPLGLTDSERSDLIAFMQTLSAAPKTALLPR